MTKDELHQKAVEELLAEIPADIRDSVKDSLLGSKKLRDGFLRQDEFSRQMDDVTKEKKRLEAWEAEAKTTVDGWQKYVTETASEAAAKSDALKAYEAKFGKLDATVTATVAGLTAADVEKLLEERGKTFFNSTLEAADRMTSLRLKAFKEYGEDIDSKELIALANKEGVTVERAFDIWASPKVEAKRNTEFDKRLADAKEEGRREGLSGKLPLPGNDAGMGTAAFINSKLPGATERSTRIDAAIADLNSRIAERAR